MAFATSDLDTIIFGQRQLHLLTNNDTVAAIVASDYLNSAYERFNVGDLILVAADLDGTPAMEILIVTVASSTVVTVVNSAI